MMATVTAGERIGRLGQLGIGCSASVFDSARRRMLLIRRADNGRWAVPGGFMEPGEGVAEACAREVWEETGLRVRVVRLVSVYTNPHLLLEFADGNRWQMVVLHFEAEPIDGELATGDETTELGYFSRAEIDGLDMGRLDRLRVTDAFDNSAAAVIRDEF
jgi:ADP-ribose pyrophosphatase YjhB (NUDIX family)